MAEMRFDNARGAEQLARMKRHAESGTCHFCPDGFHEHTHPVIKDAQYWFVTGNDDPYPGAKYHYLIVSRDHVTRLTETTNAAWAELQDVVLWLQDHLATGGYSFFVRNGDMSFTGATLDHLHFHFLVGVKKEETSEKLKVTLGYKESPGK